MNPLDLTGPQFLLFYLAWGVGGLLLAWMLRASRLSKFQVLVDTRPWIPGYYPQESEAYAIALLRGGRKEAVRILLGRLVSAGLVEVTENGLRRTPNPEGERSLLPLERTAFHAVSPAGLPYPVEPAIELAVSSHLDALELEIERQGLVTSPAERQALRNVQMLALLLVSGLGLAKLFVALARGKTNVGFLLILLAAYTLAALLLLRPPRLTSAGRLYIEWLRESHQGLVPLAANGGGGLGIATGIYGLAAVPALADTVDRRRRQNEGDGAVVAGSGDSGGGSGGSDGGSSSCGGGDGGGGGCGGGGCGGCGGS
jgi:uncharacterized protein (TIGR04222 family)